MYGTLHEADVYKFAEIADDLVRKRFPDTNLRRFRLLYGCTQAKLSRLSGVSLSSIQMYEQRQKNINRAAPRVCIGSAKYWAVPWRILLKSEETV